MGDTKKSGTFQGKSNKLGHGGRAAQLKSQGVPGGVIGNIAREKRPHLGNHSTTAARRRELSDMNTEENMKAAGFQKPEVEQSKEQQAKLREVEARLHSLTESAARTINTITYIKGMRVDVDRSIKAGQQLAGPVNRGTGGRELALAITKLQEAKMWLDKMLEEVGHPLSEEYRDEV